MYAGDQLRKFVGDHSIWHYEMLSHSRWGLLTSLLITRKQCAYLLLMVAQSDQEDYSIHVGPCRAGTKSIGVFLSQNFLLFCLLSTLNIRPSQSILIRAMEVGILCCPCRVGPP